MCSQYAKQVVDTEWTMMREGTYCPIARGRAIHLMDSLMDFEPKTEKEKAIYPVMVQQASEFWQNRQARLGIAEKGLPAIEWVVLLTGGVVTVIFTYFFGMENAKLQILMTAMVTLLIAMNLCLLLMFASPFSGDLAVHVDAFNDLQNIFTESSLDPTK
jgi:ABC-type branched-subunit amino acid transport system permease subunit